MGVRKQKLGCRKHKLVSPNSFPKKHSKTSNPLGHVAIHHQDRRRRHGGNHQEPCRRCSRSTSRKTFLHQRPRMSRFLEIPGEATIVRPCSAKLWPLSAAPITTGKFTGVRATLSFAPLIQRRLLIKWVELGEVERPKPFDPSLKGNISPSREFPLVQRSDNLGAEIG
ncbi:hypothetical protein V8G54_031203 [Vigna mungo]|uniref:Uncharacterized protein n=1 Tax=Vigna mungo TaxID=3915 RepID=A0AAQ3MXW6_VIGMU